MLEIKGLTKKYNKLTAIDNVNLKVESATISILLGPNGAGKSTMMKCITGVLRYEGDIHVCGYNNKSSDARRRLGYTPEVPALYDLLTPMEHMEFIAKAYDIKDWEPKAEALLERFDLDTHKKKVGNELSKGMSQKVSICCSLLIDAEVILFDEPMIGLDPAAIRELKTVFAELRDQGKAVFISTHIIDSVQELWDRAFIMHNGKVERTINSGDIDNSELENIFFKVTGDSGQDTLS
ncbi:MAG: ABC transporter ATP-binding protein [Clostridiales bacterium]|nr:ABC transporter ATP-binding protein [Clostridiales bacterium]